MYVSLDMNNLQLICKHPDFSKCWDYSIIAVGEDYQVFPADDKQSWMSLTALEIQTLYVNMTGNPKGIMFPKEKCAEVFIQYCMELAETVIDDNVHKQAAWCIENQRFNLCYVKRGDLPAGATTIWITTPYNELVEADGMVREKWKPAIQPAFKGNTREITAASAPTPREPRQSNATPQATARPARSGACARIWELADSEAAKDEYRSILETKDFKKHVRELLVAEGINPSTISVQLSKWQKEKGLN